MKPKQCKKCEFYHHFPAGRDVMNMRCIVHQCWVYSRHDSDYTRGDYTYKMESNIFPCCIFEDCECANGGKGGKDKYAYGFVGDGCSDIAYTVAYERFKKEDLSTDTEGIAKGELKYDS